MSNLIKKKIFLPQLLFCEINFFNNGLVCWFSGPSYTFKRTYTNVFFFNVPSKDLVYISPIPNLAFDFFKTQKSICLKKENKNLSLLHIELQRLFVGASVGFKNFLRIKGVGYKFNILRLHLIIQAGYSHLLSKKIPILRSFTMNKKNTLICGKSPHLLELNTFFAATRSLRIPDVYKGKGIRYRKDVFFRKEGKKKKIV